MVLASIQISANRDLGLELINEKDDFASKLSPFCSSVQFLKVDNADNHEFNYVLSSQEDFEKLCGGVQYLSSAEEVDEEKLLIVQLAKNDVLKVSKKGLFHNYQFFTPGIFMCLIVSGFLILIFSVALKWTSSIEISYSSFEKEVDYEKKNE